MALVEDAPELDQMTAREPGVVDRLEIDRHADEHAVLEVRRERGVRATEPGADRVDDVSEQGRGPDSPRRHRGDASAALGGSPCAGTGALRESDSRMVGSPRHPWA